MPQRSNHCEQSSREAAAESQTWTKLWAMGTSWEAAVANPRRKHCCACQTLPSCFTPKRDLPTQILTSLAIGKHGQWKAIALETGWRTASTKKRSRDQA